VRVFIPSKSGNLALTLRERIVSSPEGESISCPQRKHTDMRAPILEMRPNHALNRMRHVRFLASASVVRRAG